MKRLQSGFGWLAAAVGSLLLFLYLSLLFVPSQELLRLAGRALSPYGLSLAASETGKLFPLGISFTKVVLADERGALLKFDHLAFRPGLLSLLAGRVVVICDGVLGPGSVRGELELTRKGRLELQTKGIPLEEIPFFVTAAGARVKGVSRVEATIRNFNAAAEGWIRTEVSALDLGGVTIGGTPLPDSSFRTLQGMLRIAGGRVKVESMTLQGDGLYARLSGDLPAGSAPAATGLNLNLELMPKPDFLERQKLIFLLLVKYSDSPGHYRLPIRGTLASPQLQ